MALRLGAFFSSKADVYKAIHDSNMYHGRETKTVNSNQKKLRVQCAHGCHTCLFRVNANCQRSGPNEGMWKITTLHNAHTCPDGNGGRERQVSRSRLSQYVPAIKGFVPVRTANSKTRQAQQLMDTVKNANGMQLKYAQANSIVQEKRSDEPQKHYVDFQYIESLFDALRAADSTGSYEIKWKKDGEDRRFQAFYIAFGASKEFFRRTRLTVG